MAVVKKSPSCFFNPSTCRHQSFSVPEKLVYYLAKNVTNAKTYQKLVETCKYFFKVNPVIVVPKILCYAHGWCAVYKIVDYKYNQQINFKLWVTRYILCSDDATQLIPLIYKNDAATVCFEYGEPLKLEDFLFFAENAKELLIYEQLVQYENGETVQLEDIVKNLPKVKDLTFEPCYGGGDVNSNTVRKLKEVEHFKHLSEVVFTHATEAFNVEDMFDLILENKHIKIDVKYRKKISAAYKERVLEYSRRLKNENGCTSVIICYNTTDPLHSSSSSEDDSYEVSYYSGTTFSEDDSSTTSSEDDLLFPWNNEEDEEWELPWDKTE